ncbi:MAG: glycosyltransferase family 4 protein [Bacillota bacterium]
MSKKYKVLFIDHAQEMGGAEFSLFYLLKYLEKDTVEPILLSPQGSSLSEKVTKELDANIKIIPHSLCSPKNFLFFTFGIAKLFKILINEKIDIIHINSYRSVFYGFMGLFLRKKIIWHVRDIFNDSLFKKILPFFASHIICISKAVYNQFPEKYNRKKTIISNGVDLEEYNNAVTPTLKKELNISSETFLVGMVGRIDRWKGFHHLLNVIPEIKHKNPNIHYVIVGDEILTKEKGYLEELKQYVKNNNLQNDVSFLGQRTDIPQIMKSLDLFVSCSDNEPFGRVIIESLAMGTPALVNNSGGAAEIVENEICGYKIDLSKTNNLKEKVLWLSVNPKTVEEMGLLGIRRVKEFYTARNTSKKVTNLYSLILNEK